MRRGGLSPTIDAAMPSFAGDAIDRLCTPAMLCEP